MSATETFELVEVYKVYKKMEKGTSQRWWGVIPSLCNHGAHVRYKLSSTLP